jgi:hypothetical protein
LLDSWSVVPDEAFALQTQVEQARAELPALHKQL